MTDKEVGELWARAKLPLVRELILKLVEEGAKLAYIEEDTLRYSDEWESMPDKIGDVRTAARENTVKLPPVDTVSTRRRSRSSHEP